MRSVIKATIDGKEQIINNVGQLLKKDECIISYFSPYVLSYIVNAKKTSVDFNVMDNFRFSIFIRGLLKIKILNSIYYI